MTRYPIKRPSPPEPIKFDWFVVVVYFALVAALVYVSLEWRSEINRRSEAEGRVEYMQPKLDSLDAARDRERARAAYREYLRKETEWYHAQSK